MESYIYEYAGMIIEALAKLLKCDPEDLLVGLIFFVAVTSMTFLTAWFFGFKEIEQGSKHNFINTNTKD